MAGRRRGLICGLVLALIVTGLTVAPAGPVAAYERATEFSAEGSAMLRSGVTVSIATGTTPGAQGSVTLGSAIPAAHAGHAADPAANGAGPATLAGHAADGDTVDAASAPITAPAGMATAPAMSINVRDSGPIDSTYQPVGTLTVRFSPPVHDARLHFFDLGATAFATRLVVTSGPALVPRAGWTGWTVSSTQAAPTSPGMTSTVGCGSDDTDTPRGCGTVQLLGTASSVTFRVDVARTSIADAPTATVDSFDLSASIDDDLGNAPASYGAAAHALSDLTIGATVTADNTNLVEGAVPPVQATDSGNAEITFPPLTTAADGHPYAITVPVAGVSAPATLAGWIDANGNGQFDATERAVASVGVGASSVVLRWPSMPTLVPGHGREVRLRLGYDATQVSSPTGYADSGEVEDHTVDIGSSGPTCAGPVYALVASAPSASSSAGPAPGGSSSGGSSLATVNLATGALTTIGALRGAATAFAINPLDQLGYAALASGISVIDPATGATLSTFTPSGGSFPTTALIGGAIDRDGLLYLVERDSNTLVRIDLNPASPGFHSWNSVTFGGVAISTADLAVNPVDSALYVIDPASHRLSRIDPHSGARTELGSVPAAAGIADTFDSAGNLYDIGADGHIRQVDLTGPAAGVKLGPVTDVTPSAGAASATGGASTVRAASTANTVRNAAGCVIAEDYGDAPASYQSANPPRSEIDDRLTLGRDVDAEPGPATNNGTLDGLGDDTGDGRDDDDAFTTFPALDVAATTASVTVPLTNGTSAAATLAGWIDTNGNGQFDPAERAVATVPDGAISAVLTWSGLAGLHVGRIYARLRLFGGSVADPAPTGPAVGTAAPAGEIEDYSVRVHQAPAITSPANGALLATRTPVISGTAEPGGAITVAEGNSVLCTTTVTAAGTWACTPIGAFVDAVHVLSVTNDAPDGDHQPGAAVTITVDATPPGTPVITAPAMDAWVATGTPTISGTGESGSTISVRTGTSIVCTATATAGAWSCSPTTPLTDGAHPLTAVAADPAGNTATSAPVLITVDTTAPPPPAISSPANGATVAAAKPVLAGTGEPTDTVTVADGTGAAICAATVSAAGTWTCTATVAMTDGPATLTPTATDLAGHSTPGATVQVTFDTTAPPAPVITVPRAGSAINTTTPTISGSGEPGDTVTVRPSTSGETAAANAKSSAPASGSACSAIVAASGAWSCQVATALPEGVTILTPVQTDEAGNAATGTGIRVLIDVSPPPAPVIASPAAGSFTNATRPVISGTGELNDTIKVTRGDTVVCSTTVIRGGVWTCVPTDALPTGPSTLIATARDQAGNTTAGAASVVTIDTTPPTAAIITTPANGSVTNNSRVSLSGTGEPGDTIEVTDGSGASVCVATVTATGKWSCAPGQSFADGPAMLTVTATDRAGNVTPGAPTIITIDTTPPPVPAVTHPATGTFVGTSTPVVSGSGEPGDTVTVADSHGDAVCTATVGAAPPAGTTGSWSCTTAHALAEGAVTLVPTSTDPAGNSTSGAVHTFTIDTTAPTAPVIIAPANGSVTRNRTGAVTGTGEPTDLISVRNGAVLLCTAHVTSAGTWSCTSTIPMADGLAHLSAIATDRAGNRTTGAIITVTIDGTPPIGATIIDPAAGSTIFTNTPVIHGIGEANDTIRVEAGTGATVCLATVQADASWSCPAADPLPEGVVTLTTVATDSAGNQTTAVAIYVRIDSGLPVAAVITTPSDGAAVATTRPAISGTGEPGDTVRVTDGNLMTVCIGAVAITGTWSCRPTAALPPGLVTLAALTTDPAGNEIPGSPIQITVDTAPPPAPVITSPVAGQAGPTPMISGAAEAGDTVEVIDGIGALICTAAADAGRTWSCRSAQPLPLGAGTLTPIASDRAGNTTPGPPIAITVVAP